MYTYIYIYIYIYMYKFAFIYLYRSIYNYIIWPKLSKFYEKCINFISVSQKNN